MQFSTKIDGFEQNDSQGFENSYNSYEQYPLENFLIFTIYQNYTLALKSDVTSCDHVVRCRGSQECGSRFVNFIGDGTVFA